MLSLLLLHLFLFAFPFCLQFIRLLNAFARIHTHTHTQAYIYKSAWRNNVDVLCVCWCNDLLGVLLPSNVISNCSSAAISVAFHLPVHVQTRNFTFFIRLNALACCFQLYPQHIAFDSWLNCYITLRVWMKYEKWYCFTLANSERNILTLLLTETQVICTLWNFTTIYLLFVYKTVAIWYSHIHIVSIVCILGSVSVHADLYLELILKYFKTGCLLCFLHSLSNKVRR